MQDGLTDGGDPRLLEVVLENLLRNAWKFTSAAATRPSSSSAPGPGARRPGGRAVYYVRDNGVGFDAA